MKIMAALLMMFVAVSLFAGPQQSAGGTATAMQKPAKLDRVSGTIVRSTPQKSILTVKQNRSEIEKTVLYSPATKWTKGNKAVDMKDFKDGSRVVCVGRFDEKGELSAARIDLQ